mmetsp:Transcript_10995/g.23987  ORF Transcript_10995/g.23987 Transcript_10995/m.23987 type:complete len:203 (-) Transcript_10995:201-809(-)
MLQREEAFVGAFERQVRKGTERAKACDDDAVLVAHAHELRLLVVRVQLDLHHCGRDGGVREYVPQQRGAHVAHPDVSREPARDQHLHRLPRLLEGDERKLDGGHRRVWVVDPLGRVALLEVDVPLREREVHEVEVDVVEAEVGERAAARGLNVLRRVVCVPELGGDKKILTTDEAFAHRTPDALANLGLVGVVGGTIEVAVP